MPIATSSHATVRREADAQASGVAQVWQPLAAVPGVAYLTEAIVEALRVVSPF